MIKNLPLIFAILILLISCNQKISFSEELNENSSLHSGEWFSTLDTLSGLSIRKNKIAFFKNNKFASGDVCDYLIVDSISSKGHEKIILNTYLKLNCYTDTIYHKIENRNDSILTLNFQGKRDETFILNNK